MWERAHPRAHDREIFLILRGVPGQREVPATVGTVRWQRRVVLLVDVSGWATMRRASVGGAGFAARPTRWTSGRAARERRGLAMPFPARFIEIVFEPINFLAQLVAVAAVPIPVTIGALVFAPQSFNLAPLAFELTLLPFELPDQLVAGRCAPSRVHAPVMARLKNLYKSENVDRGCHRRSATTITR
jgi:hypothetical protein